MKAAIPILLILLIVVFMLVMMVLPMEGGTMTPGSVQSTEASTNPYVGTFDTGTAWSSTPTPRSCASTAS